MSGFRRIRVPNFSVPIKNSIHEKQKDTRNTTISAKFRGIYPLLGRHLTKHPSIPYNPDIANALFRSGYIESWGRGTLKMINECIRFNIPKPGYFYDMSGFWVEFRKDIYNAEYLKSTELNDRQIKAIQYLKKNNKITNSKYQQLNMVSRETATRDLKDLFDKNLINSSGQKGAGAYYTLN